MISTRSLNRQKPLASAAVLAIIGCGGVMPAFGQDAPAASTSPGDDVIVVTAQRREQRLQDVGIAVTAVSEQGLVRQNVNNATDLVRVVPELKMNAYSSAQVVFNIRGVSQNDYGDQQEPPVAVYQDDSYGSSINLASFPTFDLARVEVLRGPQGTLFGRNATGGAVQFISNLPTKSYEGYATVQTGSYGQIVTQGAISGPLTDNLQFRVAGIRDRDKGYIKNINPGLPAQGANNHWALRGILAWQPSDTISTRLTVRYLRADQERQAGMYSPIPACPNAQGLGEYLDPNTTCSYWVGLGTPGPGTTATGYRNDAINPVRGGDPYRTAGTDPSYVNREVFGATLHTELTLGQVDLISITDYQHGNKFYIEDGDGTPEKGINFFQGAKLDQVSQELRASTKFGANQLTVGAFGMYIKGNYTGQFANLFYGYDPLAIFKQTTKSYAFFAQDEWSVSDQIKLIGGLRYWHDDKRGSYFASEPSTGVSLTFNPSEVSYSSFGVVQNPVGLRVTPANATPSFKGVTARAEVDYKPTNDVLVYLSYNRGSKSGGFTFPTGTPFPGAEVTALNGIPYKPERLDSYEIGLKSTVLLNTTLNLAAFYYDYHDYQAYAQYGLVQTVINLSARSKGVEVEFNTRPVRGLTLTLNGSFLDTNVKNVPLPDGVSLVERDLPQAPGFSGSAFARYEFALAAGTASVQGDVQHSGKFCFTVLCSPDEQEGAYTVANFRIGYAPDNARWEIAAFVNNAFKEVYRTYAADQSLIAGDVAGVYARPRTWGATATLRFGSH